MDIHKLSNLVRKQKQASTNLLLGKAAVMLALTYDCQCSCPHCGTNKQSSSDNLKLTHEEIVKILEDCFELGAAGIYFFGGEPLLVPELPDYIALAHQRNVLTSLDTNGYLLDQTMAESLKNAGLTAVRISIDYPEESKHDASRGLPGIYKKAVAALDICHKLGIITYISTFATKQKLRNGDLQKIIALAKKHGANVRILSSICSGKWKNNKQIPLSQEEISQLHGLLEKDAVVWENNHNLLPPFRCKCSMKELCYISPYGDVQPCCYFPLVVGNTRKEPLKDIIQRMWSLDFFKIPFKGDCPVNSKEIVEKYLKNHE